MDVSCWKESEVMAAKRFPGGKRRTRVGGSYALVADDVIWGKEFLVPQSRRKPPRIIKKPLSDSIGAIYIDNKKKKRSSLVTEFKQVEKKYLVYLSSSKDRLVLITHQKSDKRHFVTVAGDFFHELIRAWCWVHGFFINEMRKELRYANRCAGQKHFEDYGATATEKPPKRTAAKVSA